MSKQTLSKKPASLDWHKADIKAALEKAGWSLRRLSLHHGYKSPSTLKHALSRPWPKAERLIAAALGVAPQLIWPTRYNDQGQPDRGKAKKSNGCLGGKCTPTKPARNSAQREAA
ncbi:MAG: helix-turn-helix transcriptional regulator [Gammaproteobacteria bacterium]|nr:helix-turn-helix transcriptional regulator [Gammaproteobacteria bacterium]